MGFDDANFQEPPDKAEYETYEKEEKRKLSECCCPEGDFRFCHGEKDRLLLQIRAAEPVIGAARLMVKHQQDRHELSSCCHDVTPTNAYLLERALKEWDAAQKPVDAKVCSYGEPNCKAVPAPEPPTISIRGGHMPKDLNQKCECNYKTVQGQHADGCPALKRVEGGHKCVRCRMRDVPAVGLTCESCYG